MNCSSHWPPRETANQAKLHCREWWALCSDILPGFVRTTNISAQVTWTTAKIIHQTNSVHYQLCNNYKISSGLNLVHYFFSSGISLFAYRKEKASARTKKKKSHQKTSSPSVSHLKALCSFSCFLTEYGEQLMTSVLVHKAYPRLVQLPEGVQVGLHGHCCLLEPLQRNNRALVKRGFCVDWSQ